MCINPIWGYNTSVTFNKDKMKTKLKIKLEKLCNDLDAKTKEFWLDGGGKELEKYPFHTYKQGSKYIKIIYNETLPYSANKRSVWGYINYSNPNFKVGDVLKAQTWSTPALNKARGNILEGYEIFGDRIFSPDYLLGGK